MSHKTDFDETYQKYIDTLYKIAFVFFANSDDVEDILQEVFISYIYKSPDFKTEEHKKAWLIRATQNKSINLLKSSSRKSVSFDDLQIPAQNENQELKIDVLKEILSLPPKYKTVIILYYYNDYSVEEIAKTLKISLSAVKMRLKRSREILKIELEDYRNE